MIAPRYDGPEARKRGDATLSPPRPRQGSLLAEVAISAAMLMIAMTLTVKVLGWVGAERRAWDRRQWAVQEVANVMEKATAQPYDNVTSSSARLLTLSPQAKQVLPEAELNVDITEDSPSGGAGSKRIAIKLRWRNRAGAWESPARLVAWIYRGGLAR
jgi:hypothetical protein